MYILHSHVCMCMKAKAAINALHHTYDLHIRMYYILHVTRVIRKTRNIKMQNL